MPKATLISSDEYSTIYSVPVTLRQIEAIKPALPIEGRFGLNADEHEQLLDDLSILRITFGVEYKPETNTVENAYNLEVYQARIGSEAQWECALDTRRAMGWYGSRWTWPRVEWELEQIVDELLTDPDDLLAPYRAEYEAWGIEINEQEQA